MKRSILAALALGASACNVIVPYRCHRSVTRRRTSTAGPAMRPSRPAFATAQRARGATRAALPAGSDGGSDGTPSSSDAGSGADGDAGSRERRRFQLRLGRQGREHPVFADVRRRLRDGPRAVGQASGDRRRGGWQCLVHAGECRHDRHGLTERHDSPVQAREPGCPPVGNRRGAGQCPLVRGSTTQAASDADRPGRYHQHELPKLLPTTAARRWEK